MFLKSLLCFCFRKRCPKLFVTLWMFSPMFAADSIAGSVLPDIRRQIFEMYQEFGAIRNPTSVVLFHFCTVLGVYINTMTTTCRNIYIFYRFPFSPLKDPYPDPFFHRIRIWVTQNDRNRTHIIPLQDTSQANLEQLQRYISYNSLKGRRLVGFIIRQEFVN